MGRQLVYVPYGVVAVALLTAVLVGMLIAGYLMEAPRQVGQEEALRPPPKGSEAVPSDQTLEEWDMEQSHGLRSDEARFKQICGDLGMVVGSVELSVGSLYRPLLRCVAVEAEEPTQ